MMVVKVNARERDTPKRVKVRNSGGEIQSISSGSSAEDIEKFFGWDE